jgi:crotonobetainyl-CoA:carnitine CoA-transferase CaiB-like acyl-CoA transferase
VQHPRAGRMRLPRPAGAFLGDAPTLSPAPVQGEHTLEILQELGFDQAHIEGLLARAAVKGAAA